MYANGGLGGHRRPNRRQNHTCRRTAAFHRRVGSPGQPPRRRPGPRAARRGHRGLRRRGRRRVRRHRSGLRIQPEPHPGGIDRAVQRADRPGGRAERRARGRDAHGEHSRDQGGRGAPARPGARPAPAARRNPRRVHLRDQERGSHAGVRARHGALGRRQRRDGAGNRRDHLDLGAHQRVHRQGERIAHVGEQRGRQSAGVRGGPGHRQHAGRQAARDPVRSEEAGPRTAVRAPRHAGCRGARTAPLPRSTPCRRPPPWPPRTPPPRRGSSWWWPCRSRLPRRRRCRRRCAARQARSWRARPPAAAPTSLLPC